MMRWSVTLAYHRAPGTLWVRARLAVLSRSGVIWIGRDTPHARRAAGRLATYLNRRGIR